MRSYAVSAGKDGYRVLLLEVSAFRGFVEAVAFVLCTVTGQRLCTVLCSPAARWAGRKEKVVGSVDLAADQLKEIDPEFWAIFEGEDA